MSVNCGSHFFLCKQARHNETLCHFSHVHLLEEHPRGQLRPLCEMLQQPAAISSQLQFPKTLFQGTLTSVACVPCISFSSGFAHVSCRNECAIRVLWTFLNSMQLITPSVLLKMMLWLPSLWPLRVYCHVNMCVYSIKTGINNQWPSFRLEMCPPLKDSRPELSMMRCWT